MLMMTLKFGVNRSLPLYRHSPKAQCHQTCFAWQTNNLITARIRRMTGGYIFSLSTLFWGEGVPDPALDRGGTRSSLGWGGTRSSLGQGGVPDPALDRGGTQSSLGWGGYPIQPWMGGYPIQPWTRGVPNPALDRGGSRSSLGQGGYPIQPWRGVPNPALDGGVPNPALDRGVPQPWKGGYPISGGTPTLDERGTPS